MANVGRKVGSQGYAQCTLVSISKKGTGTSIGKDLLLKRLYGEVDSSSTKSKKMMICNEMNDTDPVKEVLGQYNKKIAVANPSN